MPVRGGYYPKNEAGRVRRLMRLDILADQLSAGKTPHKAGEVLGVHGNMLQGLMRELRRRQLRILS